MKLLLSLLSLFVLACIAPVKSQRDLNYYLVPIDNGWNFFVFDIINENREGRAFIANNEIWSAKHIFLSEDPGVKDDVMDLGHTDVFGLTLSTDTLALDQIVYYRTKNGVKFLMVNYIEDSFFTVVPLNQIEPGDSGSPVLSLKDGSVVGIVSHYLTDLNKMCTCGWVTRIVLHKGEEK